MTLKEYAKQKGISYMTASRWKKAGRITPQDFDGSQIITNVIPTITNVIPTITSDITSEPPDVTNVIPDVTNVIPDVILELKERIDNLSNRLSILEDIAESGGQLIRSAKHKTNITGNSPFSKTNQTNHK